VWYIYNFISLNNSRFGYYVDRIYPNELEIEIPQTQQGPLHTYTLEMDSEGRLRTKLYDKRDKFNFAIVNFSFICRNIPAVPAYGISLSQLKRYFRACNSYHDFLESGLLLTRTNDSSWIVKMITTKVLRSPPCWL
jgi:hypothetical protein